MLGPSLHPFHVDRDRRPQRQLDPAESSTVVDSHGRPVQPDRQRSIEHTRQCVTVDRSGGRDGVEQFEQRRAKRIGVLPWEFERRLLEFSVNREIVEKLPTDCLIDSIPYGEPRAFEPGEIVDGGGYFRPLSARHGHAPGLVGHVARSSSMSASVGASRTRSASASRNEAESIDKLDHASGGPIAWRRAASSPGDPASPIGTTTSGSMPSRRASTSSRPMPS